MCFCKQPAHYKEYRLNLYDNIKAILQCEYVHKLMEVSKINHLNLAVSIILSTTLVNIWLIFRFKH